jgi:RNA polymerase sigma-70 factor, ECF subfamily
MRHRDGTAELTEQLRAWHQGDPKALSAVISLAYPELRKLANSFLSAESSRHTLQPTALVNEAFLRLVKASKIEWQDRLHFLAVSARLMRQILVDHARLKRTHKRSASVGSIDTALESPSVMPSTEDIWALHLALDALAELDPRKEQVVELRFFGGLSVPETAQVLGVSEDTVIRDWRLAKSWLLRRLTEEATTHE